MRIGIDPGLQGAIAFVCDDGTLANVCDMPTMVVTKKRQQVNPAELVKILETYKDAVAIAHLEQVSAMPKQGVSAMFSFGTSYGIVQGVLAALRIPMILVTPQSWKKKANLLGKDKDTARTLAQRLYPEAPLGRKRDVGRADAILIALYGGGFGFG